MQYRYILFSVLVAVFLVWLLLTQSGHAFAADCVSWVVRMPDGSVLHCSQCNAGSTYCT